MALPFTKVLTRVLSTPALTTRTTKTPLALTLITAITRVSVDSTHTLASIVILGMEVEHTVLMGIITPWGEDTGAEDIAATLEVVTEAEVCTWVAVDLPSDVPSTHVPAQ
jgi:hypothetical protein